MPHETPLIATLVIGLVFAFGLGFVARHLRLPPLLGYLLAGVAVGPYTPGFVADVGLASQLAEIGVILLMFGVGLHFSIRDLLAVRAVALPGALAQILVAVGACLGLALLWGWSLPAGAVLGLALSVASTVVLLRVLEERGVLDRPEGHIAVGWLIVQDVVMVLALVLLPSLAGESGKGLATAVALTLGKVAVFILLILLVGARVVPWLLGRVARTGSRELFTLSVLAAAFGIAYGSTQLFGVSFALGAFFAGVVLAESDLSHQAAADSLPLRDAFAVLFFVSVGMLFDPAILIREPLSLLAVLAVIVLVKSLASIAVMLALRHTIAMALTVSAGLAQIGEFSFILAGLGAALGVLPPEGRDLILGGALLSITLNPLVFAAARWIETQVARQAGLGGWLDRRARPFDGRIRPDAQRWRDHIVIAGYGRVGSAIGRILREHDLPMVIVELDRRIVESQRADGLSAIWGDAAMPGVLEAAQVDRARLIVIATPGGFQTRQILDRARAANGAIEVVARTHSESERQHLERQGANMVILGERELALGMAGSALQCLGFADADVQAIVSRARATTAAATDGDGG